MRKEKKILMFFFSCTWVIRGSSEGHAMVIAGKKTKICLTFFFPPWVILGCSEGGVFLGADPPPVGRLALFRKLLLNLGQRLCVSGTFGG
jgi:hypothetical protein